MKKLCVGVAFGIIIGCLASENREFRQMVEKGKQKVKDLTNM